MYWNGYGDVRLSSSVAMCKDASTANEIAGRSNEARLRALRDVQSIEIIQTGREWTPSIRIESKYFGQMPASASSCAISASPGRLQVRIAIGQSAGMKPLVDSTGLAPADFVSDSSR